MPHTAAPRWVSTLVLSGPASRQPPPPALRARATVAMLLLASLGGAFGGAFGGASGLAAGARAPSSVIPAPVSQEPIALQPVPQGVSLLGRELLSQATTPEQAAAIEEARRALAAEPGDAERVIVLGRALSEVWRYREAIEVYGRAIDQHPENPLLYRHRGHRYISLRDFERAEADLERAASLASASPGKLGAGPTFDIWYHLGLARYLQRDFAGAAEAYLACRNAIAEGDDESRVDESMVDESMVAVSHWLYMSLRRAGRDAEAAAVLEPIHAGMTVDENRAYYELLRLYRAT